MRKRFVFTITAIILITFSVVASSQEGSSFTEYRVFIETDGDIEAFFDGKANGSITYYVDGIEVKSEFSDIWGCLNDIKGDLDQISNYALTAFANSNDNAEKIKKHAEELNTHDATLSWHTFAINDTMYKVAFLGNEIVAFEGAYFNFVNETNSTFSEHSSNIDSNSEEIDVLRARVNNLNFMIGLLRNFIIGLLVLAFVLYVINKRYPLKEMTKKYNRIIKDGRPKPIYDFSGKFKYMGEKLNLLTRIRVKRNPKRSPLRFLFSFLHINK